VDGRVKPGHDEKKWHRTSIPILLLLALAACSPRYVDDADNKEMPGDWPRKVVFHVHDAWKAKPPDCVAVMPLGLQRPSLPEIDPADAARVRQSLWAHLATQAKREVKLARVDHVLAEVKGDRRALGERLKCDAVLEGEITEFGSMFLGLYSRVAVGLDLRMVRASDGALLWEGRHLATSHGGGVPLDPVGVAMGVMDAAGNVGDEQMLRVTDDAARRLVSTIPDNAIAAIDAPPDPPAPAAPADPVAAAERLLMAGDHAGALAAADRAIAADPRRADAWALKGRVLILERDYAAAEPAILKAVALQPGNPRHLDALGAVNGAKGDYDRALAAYNMAVEADRGDGFAWYNMGVIHHNSGSLQDSADAFYGAGMAYLKQRDYARAERALNDLKDLLQAGVPVGKEIGIIEDALAASTRRKT
jgi:tetratricopeptide (TPR) repeat protein